MAVRLAGECRESGIHESSNGGDEVTDMDEVSHLDRNREHVLDAALDELLSKNIDGFTLEGVASRAGMDISTVQQIWPNTPVLLNGALMAYADRYMPVPDTGSMHDDLLIYASSYAESVNSPSGRRLVDALLIRSNDWDVSGTRTAFLAARQRRITGIIDRGIERGECPPDTDADRFVDLLAAALCVPVLFYDRAITDDDCRYVVDIMMNGLATKR